MRAAFAAVAWDRAALAAQLRARGQDLQAGIVDIAALIAGDPALVGPALDAVRAGAEGPAAVWAAAEAQAALLAALPDPDLAQRAGDVRQVARAVADHLRGTGAPPPPAGTFILIRRKRSTRPTSSGWPRRDWPARCPSAAGPAPTPRSSRAASACPCWSAPTRRCWRPRTGARRSSTARRGS